MLQMYQRESDKLFVTIGAGSIPWKMERVVVKAQKTLTRCSSHDPPMLKHISASTPLPKE
jgi:hypothetical protein